MGLCLSQPTRRRVIAVGHTDLPMLRCEEALGLGPPVSPAPGRTIVDSVLEEQYQIPGGIDGIAGDNGWEGAFLSSHFRHLEVRRLVGNAVEAAHSADGARRFQQGIDQAAFVDSSYSDPGAED